MRVEERRRLNNASSTSTAHPPSGTRFSDLGGEKCEDDGLINKGE